MPREDATLPSRYAAARCPRAIKDDMALPPPSPIVHRYGYMPFSFTNRHARDETDDALHCQARWIPPLFEGGEYI